MITLRIALYCLAGGLAITFAALGTGGFGWWWLAGVLFASAFVPAARFGPRGFLSQFGVVFPVLMVVTVLCLWSEAIIFVPQLQQHALRDLISTAIMYTILAVVLATLATALKLQKDKGAKPELHSPAKLLGLVLVCGFAYAFYYLVFGSITYQFFTKGFYPEAVTQVAKLGIWFWPIQIARGVLMTLAVLPAIRALRLSRIQAAVAIGILLWITGGLAPLVIPNAIMSPTQRFIHVIEILTQNFSLGLTAGWLLRTKGTAHAKVAMAPATMS